MGGAQSNTSVGINGQRPPNSYVPVQTPVTYPKTSFSHPLDNINARCSGIGRYQGDGWKPRKISEHEYKDPNFRWVILQPSFPCYVQLREFGTCVATHVRLMGGRYYYSVYKLHPFSPQMDFKIAHRYEVPYKLGGQRIIFKLRFAIAEIWPQQDVVTFLSCDGLRFRKKYSDLLKINDPDIQLAINALRSDFPNELDHVLSFRTSVGPKFELMEDPNIDEADIPGPPGFTTLNGGAESQALYEQSMNRYSFAKLPEPRSENILDLNSTNAMSGIVPDVSEYNTSQSSTGVNNTTSGNTGLSANAGFGRSGFLSS